MAGELIEGSKDSDMNYPLEENGLSQFNYKILQTEEHSKDFCLDKAEIITCWYLPLQVHFNLSTHDQKDLDYMMLKLPVNPHDEAQTFRIHQLFHCKQLIFQMIITLFSIVRILLRYLFSQLVKSYHSNCFRDLLVTHFMEVAQIQQSNFVLV